MMKINFKLLFENSILKLHFGTGFDQFRQLARFLRRIEICLQNRRFSMIFLLWQILGLPVSATSVQIPKSKVVLFCPFSKMRSKIVKITKFQNAVKIALVSGFKWNRCQMEALGLIFRFFLNFEFSSIFACFIAIWTSTISGFSKKSKNPRYAMISKRVNFYIHYIFRNFFR